MHVLFIALFLLLVPISPKVYSEDKDVATPTVIVSIAPYRYLVQRIAEDTFKVVTIVPDNADPHTYEPTLKQIIKLRNACLWFKIGESFECMCARALGKSTNCQIIDLRDGLPLLPSHPCHAGHKHHNIYDSHIWLSPDLLKSQALKITNCISAINPQFQDRYQENLKNILSELDALDQEIHNLLKASNKTIPILVTHGAYGYFCKDYNLKQVSVERPSSAEPSLKELLEIMEMTKENKITKIFLQQQTGTKQGTILARKLKLEPVILDPYAEDVIENIKLIALSFSSL